MSETPTPSDIRWAEVESLLTALDIEVVERAGSRVLVRKGRERVVLHRPHPRPHLVRPAVRKLRDFLVALGVTP